MLKMYFRLFMPILLAVPLPVAGIILDCDINADGTYTCVEIDGTAIPDEVREQARESQRAYIEEARTRCVYEEPRRRSGGKAPTGAKWMEAQKRAKEKYDACIASEAEKIKQADQISQP